MKNLKSIFILSAIFAFAIVGNAQNNAKSNSLQFSQEVKSSPAFAELILRRTELESELEELLVSYTEEYPKVKDLRYELSVLQREFEKITKVKSSEAGKLTLALGKLMVRKAEIETDYWSLKNRYSEDHPQTKRAKRKLEIFDKAINEILQ